MILYYNLTVKVLQSTLTRKLHKFNHGLLYQAAQVKFTTYKVIIKVLIKNQIRALEKHV